MKIIALCASSRKDSLNKRLLNTAVKILSSTEHEIEKLNISDFLLEPYDGDVELESGIPDKAKELANKFRDSHGIIIASPEYNFSMPGLLKNLIDWMSRVKPQPFKGKFIYLMSASPSMVGGNRGLWSLRVPLEALGAFVYPDMFSLSFADTKLDDLGLNDDKLKKNLQSDILGFMSKIC